MKKAILLFLLCFSFVCLLTSCEKNHAHEFGEWSTVREANCLEEGLRERYCFCLEKETETIPTTEHVPAEMVACNWGQICSICKTVLRQPGPHEYGEFVVVTPATCKVNGEKKQTCKFCGDTVYKKIIATGHKYGDFTVIKEATCDTPGLREKYCACGDKISETLEAAHTGYWTILKEPTKTENGARELDCSVCNQKITETLYAFGSSGLQYKRITANTCTIIGIGTCTDEDVVIPEFIDGNTVVAIEDEAFKNCAFMVSLMIPATVTEIGSNIVSGASRLNTVYYYPSTTCFSATFNGAYIKKVVFGGTVAFKISDYVEEVVLSDTVTHIADSAFEGCTNLKSIVIPEGIKTVGYRAFAECTSLACVELPDTLTTIGSSAFFNCKALKSLVFPESITAIPASIFYFCESLESVVIPASVTRIDSTAFSCCTSLTEITIPGSLTYLGSEVFAYCSSLTSLTLPKEISHIFSNLFMESENLKNITYVGTIAEWRAIPKDTGWKANSSVQKVICSDGVINDI